MAPARYRAGMGRRRSIPPDGQPYNERLTCHKRSVLFAILGVDIRFPDQAGPVPKPLTCGKPRCHTQSASVKTEGNVVYVYIWGFVA